MNLLASLKHKLQILNLKKDLKSAQSEANESNWQEIGRRHVEGISKHGKFLGNGNDSKHVMRFALAGIREAGATPSLNRTEGIADPKSDYWLMTKKGQSLPQGLNGRDRITSTMAAYNELAAAIAAKKPADSPEASQPVAKSVVSTPIPTVIKPAVPAATAIPAKPVPAVAKPAASFGKKPDFSQLRGVERVSVSMKWENDRKAYFLAEAERQIAAEESAGKVDPTAGKAVTAASIASEILRQQEEAAKPKPSAWTRESGARREHVKKLASELMAKDSQ